MKENTNSDNFQSNVDVDTRDLSRCRPKPCSLSDCLGWSAVGFIVFLVFVAIPTLYIIVLHLIGYYILEPLFRALPIG